ncbi:hypothetical protein DOTSEDRAFT_53595 [Dothistroma septosporum NZE10]|uniref:Methyltransferase domain-containing protein n=1 Tax=Dothistroma septosporum (strain NZE10 / CBS 128990) TaxID=675120 RepID=N1PLZ5_DOTSN|nr:hypothetical protein DOTSEDRAFT_53595 [Dothistroma septosporum NZE10]
MATQQKAPDQAFLSAGGFMRKAMINRSVGSDVPHVIPILDSLKPGEVVLEVGCGPGGITLSIAKRYPQLKVLGVDIDAESIKDAKAAGQGLSNLSYAVADVVNLVDSIENSSVTECIKTGCSLVYSHAAIMHTSNQVQAIKSMRAACKTGGTISLKEGDMGLFFAYPEIPGMQKLMEVFPRIGCTEGADALCGRKLVSHALAAGLSRDDAHPFELSMSAQITTATMHRAGFAAGFDKIFETNRKNPELMRSAGLNEGIVSLIREGTNSVKAYNTPNFYIDTSNFIFPADYTVAVVGAGKGIGEYIAKAYPQAKASQTLTTARTAMDLDSIKNDCQSINGNFRILALAAHATDPTSYVIIVKALGRESDGRLHALVYNAGGGVSQGLFENNVHEMNFESYSTITDLNYLGALYATK